MREMYLSSDMRPSMSGKQRRGKWAEWEPRLVAALDSPAAERKAVYAECMAELGVSRQTVEMHVKAARERLGLPDTKALAKERRKARQREEKRKSGRWCALLGAECPRAPFCTDKKYTAVLACRTGVNLCIATCRLCPKRKKCRKNGGRKLWTCWKTMQRRVPK